MLHVNAICIWYMDMLYVYAIFICYMYVLYAYAICYMHMLYAYALKKKFDFNQYLQQFGRAH